MQLQSSDGRVLLADWVLPCGEPPRADLFVVRRSALAAGPATGELTVAQQDAIRASQASKGEISYYYSVNKNLGNTIVPAEPRVPRAVYAPGHAVREQTIASFAMLDGDGRVKVNFPLAGAKRLPSNGICAGFFDRSFKLAIRPDASTELSLNVPLLCEPINQHGCVVKVLEGRVVVQLAKRQADRVRAGSARGRERGVLDARRVVRGLPRALPRQPLRAGRTAPCEPGSSMRRLSACAPSDPAIPPLRVRPARADLVRAAQNEGGGRHGV